MSIEASRLIDNARIHLPGALDTAINTELFNVLDIFFRGSNIWRSDLSITTIAGTKNYALTIAAGSLPVRLLSVVDDDGYPVRATMPTMGIVSLQTAPSVAKTLTATISLSVDAPTPSTDAPAYPAWVLNQYLDGLVHGTIAHMMAHPAKPYSNATLASYHMKEFKKTIALAKSDAIRQNTTNVQAWRFPQSFASRRR